jgi:hypothetical protein
VGGTAWDTSSNSHLPHGLALEQNSLYKVTDLGKWGFMAAPTEVWCANCVNGKGGGVAPSIAVPLRKLESGVLYQLP